MSQKTAVPLPHGTPLFVVALATAAALVALLFFTATADAASGGVNPSVRHAGPPPTISAYRLGKGAVGGQAVGLAYRTKASTRSVRVRAVIRTIGNKPVKTVDLGLHRANIRQATRLRPAALGIERSGRYRVRITVRDELNRAAKRGRKVPAWRVFKFTRVDPTAHVFPLAGPFSFGGSGARFGTSRTGHKHQGQDLPAPSGTPIIAPFAGQIVHVAYQAGGAGYYVVERADDGNDYVFMHLLKGSTAVKQGQRVVSGTKIGLVGSTGASSGPHLHFEIWTGGPWQFGGKPIDPLPTLKAWFEAAPGSAVRTSAVAAAAVAPARHPLD